MIGKKKKKEKTRNRQNLNLFAYIEHPVQRDQYCALGFELPDEFVAATAEFTCILEPLDDIDVLNSRAFGCGITARRFERRSRFPGGQFFEERSDAFLHPIINRECVRYIAPVWQDGEKEGHYNARQSEKKIEEKKPASYLRNTLKKRSNFHVWNLNFCVKVLNTLSSPASRSCITIL